MTSSMESGEIPERRTASFMTIAPSWGAVKPARLLRNLPVGVRTAPTMTGVCSDICAFSFGEKLGSISLPNAFFLMRQQSPLQISFFRRFQQLQKDIED